MYGDDIFKEMMRMQHEMDRLFAQFHQHQPQIDHDNKHEVARSPICDLCETENSYIAGIELPGVEKEDIQLDVSDSVVTVKVEQKEEKKDDNEHSVSKSSFYKHMALPRDADADNAQASYKNGILRVEIPKKGQSKKRRLNIE